MNVRLYRGLLGLGLAFVASALVAAEPPKEAPKKELPFTISGPYTKDNLSIFLFHGKDTLPGKKFLTLQEALDQKKIVVHETKEVNELSVENVATDVDVFVQSGDIVKGGQQDRVLAYDLIVPAKSGKMPIPSFCVEAGRWTQRGKEDVARFSESGKQAGTKDLKLAVNYARSQDQVWAKVREAQRKLGDRLGKVVQDKDSPTSLQLTLEDKQLLAALDAYQTSVQKEIEGKTDVIGFAVAINGKVEGAEVYGSSVLFKKLWPKLLEGCATDALAEKVEKKTFEAPTAELVKTFLADAEKGKLSEKELSKRTQVLTNDTKGCIMLETRDKAGAAVIHRSYIGK
jgi:hypothetical protein